MKTTNSLNFRLVTLAALVLPLSLFGQNFGTDILHLDSRTLMTGSVETNAAGLVMASQKKQGNANNQSLQITLSGLTASNSYILSALIGADTNLTDVAAITTDANGNASLNYSAKGNGHSTNNGQGNGKGGALSAVLNPVSDIQGLVVLNTNEEAVLTADMTMPYFLQYQIKRNMSTNAVSALLQIHATTQQTQFRLTSSGLPATNGYYLVINGNVDQSVQTDSKGKFVINSLAENSLNILDVHSVVLWDTASNVVLSAQLP